jgi:hypothetical protein
VAPSAVDAECRILTIPVEKEHCGLFDVFLQVGPSFLVHVGVMASDLTR